MSDKKPPVRIIGEKMQVLCTAIRKIYGKMSDFQSHKKALY